MNKTEIIKNARVRSEASSTTGKYVGIVFGTCFSVLLIAVTARLVLALFS